MVVIKFKRILFDKQISSGHFKKIEHTIVVDFFLATTMQKIGAELKFNLFVYF